MINQLLLLVIDTSHWVLLMEWLIFDNHRVLYIQYVLFKQFPIWNMKGMVYIRHSYFHSILYCTVCSM